MTIQALMNEPVTIVTRAYTGTLDDYGNEIGTETTIEVPGYLQQLSGVEREGYVPEVTDLLVVPPDTAIQANDAVLIGTVEYEVYGPPANVWNPRTAQFHHIEATLKRVVGHEASGEQPAAPPGTLPSTLDGGTPTTVPAAVLDGGAASTTTYSGVLDGGSP